jgi:multimeric flavodoxin WrbA
MKTLIFNGSPRKNGDTVSLIRELTAHLNGEVRRIDAYDCDVRACIDCRYCWKQDGCSQKDGMQEIYNLIQEADNIVIATPMHFSEISGQLLAVLSRIQTYWCARFSERSSGAEEKARHRHYCGWWKPAGEKAGKYGKRPVADMNAQSIGNVYSHNTNDRPSKDDQDALEEIRKLGHY